MPDLRYFLSPPASSLLKRLLIAAICLLTVHCIFDDRQAGTSTSAENTIVGTARLADGKPAAGAAVSARTSEINLTANQVPKSKLIGYTLTDSAGRFTLRVPKSQADRGFFLEIEQRDFGPVSPPPHPYPEVWFKAFTDPLAATTALGGLDLDSSGTLMGSLESARGLGGKSVWIGVPGTDVFTLVQGPEDPDSSVSFALYGVPPGVHPLVLFLPAEVVITGSGDSVVAATVGSGEVRGGTSAHVGTLVVPVPD